MKYVLGVGLIVQKYKKDPKIRIFVDNLLIDEFDAENCEPTNKTMQYHHKQYKLNNWKKNGPPRLKQIEAQDRPAKFKTYLIEENILKNKKQIKIEITNDDNNYTNGFMTKSTLVDPTYIFLIPEPYIKVFKSSHINFHNDIAKVIPEKFKGQGEFGCQSWPVGDGRTKGYPFPFTYFWNNKENAIPLFGGSGEYRVNLLTNKHNIIMFDPCEDMDLPMYIADYKNPSDNKFEFKPNPGGFFIKNKLVYTGFPFSEEFFALTWEGYLDKYIYEDQRAINT